VQEGGRPLLEVPAIKPDVLLLHGQQADEEGNVQYFGAGYFDLLMAQASRHVICSVDRIVPTSTVRQSARLTKIPSAFVDAIVVTPFGAHPGGSPGLSAQDEDHIKAYVTASRDQASFDAYLASHVRGAGEDAYRRADRRHGAGRPDGGRHAVSQAFVPIKHRRLSDQVSEQIQGRIVSGELRSGDKLPPERELAESFGVSRGAVREALRNLERTGLVSLQAGSRGGAFIGEGDPSLIGDSFRNLYQLGSVSIDDLTEARLWLASTVVRIACARARAISPR
jgi:DNA-binding transcriptional regulator YhcF (GntR family)